LDDGPLVSIVTPSLNQGRFLRRTLESVLAQSYPRIEYLVMDGGSTDGSLDVLRSLGERVRWVSGPDGGQTRAINQGFARSKGEIRAYLNSDDVLRPGAVEAVVAHFRAHPDCDVAYGRADLIDEGDHVIGAHGTTPGASLERLARENCVCQPAAFWRVGPLDESLRYAMDYDYWLRLAQAGARFDYLESVLAASRVHPETKTLSQRSAMIREIFQVSLARTGRVSRTYFSALWYDRLLAGPRWLRPLVRWPPTYQGLGWLHHRWFHLAARPRA